MEDALEDGAGLGEGGGEVLLEGGLAFLLDLVGVGAGDRREVGGLAEGGAADQGAGLEVARGLLPGGAGIGGDGAEAGEGGVEAGAVEEGGGDLVGAIFPKPGGAGGGEGGGGAVGSELWRRWGRRRAVGLAARAGAVGEDVVLAANPGQDLGGGGALVALASLEGEGGGAEGVVEAVGKGLVDFAGDGAFGVEGFGVGGALVWGSDAAAGEGDGFAEGEPGAEAGGGGRGGVAAGGDVCLELDGLGLLGGGEGVAAEDVESDDELADGVGGLEDAELPGDKARVGDGGGGLADKDGLGKGGAAGAGGGGEQEQGKERGEAEAGGRRRGGHAGLPLAGGVEGVQGVDLIGCPGCRREQI